MAAPAPSDAPVRSDSEFIFVYGGLMRGCDLHHYLAFAPFVGRATTRGRLYSIGRYPGMTDGDGSVRGELYRFDNIAVALEVLDEVEEYDPLDADASMYVRALRPVRLDDGREVLAWLYLYNQDVQGRPLIAGGDWREAARP